MSKKQDEAFKKQALTDSVYQKIMFTMQQHSDYMRNQDKATASLNKKVDVALAVLIEALPGDSSAKRLAQQALTSINSETDQANMQVDNNDSDLEDSAKRLKTNPSTNTTPHQTLVAALETTAPPRRND